MVFWRNRSLPYPAERSGIEGAAWNFQAKTIMSLRWSLNTDCVRLLQIFALLAELLPAASRATDTPGSLALLRQKHYGSRQPWAGGHNLFGIEKCR